MTRLTRLSSSEFPVVVLKLWRMRRLYVQFMQLSHLPEDLGKLSKLEVTNFFKSQKQILLCLVFLVSQLGN